MVYCGHLWIPSLWYIFPVRIRCNRDGRTMGLFRGVRAAIWLSSSTVDLEQLLRTFCSTRGARCSPSAAEASVNKIFPSHWVCAEPNQKGSVWIWWKLTRELGRSVGSENLWTVIKPQRLLLPFSHWWMFQAYQIKYLENWEHSLCVECNKFEIEYFVCVPSYTYQLRPERKSFRHGLRIAIKFIQHSPPVLSVYRRLPVTECRDKLP